MKYPNTMSKAKKTADEMIPGDLIHPGEILADELAARKMTQQALADEMQMSKSEISLLVNGHRNITPVLAVGLENVLGIDAEFWMNLQIRHDIDKVRKKMQNAIDKANISTDRKQKLKRLTA
ncbi:MAG: HigA family addiction module antidote protein [Flavobacteriales bacterium]|nr:HigA family addiction module antidote protein [Flavobacteriales bacterium]